MVDLKEICQYRQPRPTNTHGTELIENSLVVALSKATMKSIWTILASCLLSNALCSVWDTHKSASPVPMQTFPISKLGGWKHSTTVRKSSETNLHLTLKHFRQYWCYGNLSVFDNREGLWPVSSRPRKLPKHYKKTGARTSVLFMKKRKHTHWIHV